jgi:hypothetical protein
MELPHAVLTGIQLDKTPPNGTIQINNGETYTSSTDVVITVAAADEISGISQIRFSNDNTWAQSTWQPYTGNVNWQLTGGDGIKTVYCQIENNAGLIAAVNSSITLAPAQPNASPFTPNQTPQTNPTFPNSTSSSTSSATPSPAPTTSPSIVPEFALPMFLMLLALLTGLFVLRHKTALRAAF